ncbi:hypothetical protein G5I_09659 [Acromyrmex echinatior]|uniref:Secreted protein n=1 Tax=Acromyrmex echinatior TaxID=103372 RepID=F4WUT1_ACREC|nr:hypothetical protein G5I_09659 [Acromyrmex echinatior]
MTFASLRMVALASTIATATASMSMSMSRHGPTDFSNTRSSTLMRHPIQMKPADSENRNGLRTHVHKLLQNGITISMLWLKNLYGETFSHCSAVAFRGLSDSFTGYLNRFEVSKRFGAVRTAATDLALTRLYLDS